MRPRLAALAAILAFAIANPHPLLSKGKKPDATEDEEYSRIQEEMMQEKKGDTAPSLVPGSASPPAPAFTPEPEAESQREPAAETPQQTYPPQETVKEEPAPAPEGAAVAVVWVWQESKDCLWNLAKKHYKDPWKWKKIYLDNRNSILNPGVIFPKQRIVISPLEAPAD